jgi:hypothetical protein
VGSRGVSLRTGSTGCERKRRSESGFERGLVVLMVIVVVVGGCARKDSPARVLNLASGIRIHQHEGSEQQAAGYHCERNEKRRNSPGFGCYSTWIRIHRHAGCKRRATRYSKTQDTRHITLDSTRTQIIIEAARNGDNSRCEIVQLSTRPRPQLDDQDQTRLRTESKLMTEPEKKMPMTEPVRRKPKMMMYQPQRPRPTTRDIQQSQQRGN